MRICPTCNRRYRSEIAVCPKDGSPLDIPREWRAGDSISERFSLVEKIGHGSMGPVFKAKLLPYGGSRALKPLGPQLADDEFLIKYFQRIINAASALRHLNVVHVESLERSADGRPFIVMEYAPGLSLRELIARGGFIPAPDAVNIALQICVALDRAHRVGITHLNLNPDNVMIAVEHDGAVRVKVREFGMADLREAAAERGKHVGDVVMMDHGAVVGTFEYMSPEQAAGTSSSMLDGRADLYSLGVVMFETLTGELPIHIDDPASVLHRMETTAENELLCSTVIRALHKDPDFRYSSAAEMAVDLSEVANSLAKPTSVEAGFDSRDGAVSVSVSPGTSQPLIEGVHPDPTTNIGVGQFELTDPRVPESDRGPKVHDKSGLGAAAASTDWEFDKLRKSWTHSRGKVLERHTQGGLLRTSLATVGVVMVVLLVFWALYRGPGLLSRPEGKKMGQQASPELQAAPPGEATSDVSSHDIDSLPVEPPPPSQAPLTVKQAEHPSQAEAPDDEGAPQAPPLPKVRLHRQKTQSAADVRIAGEQAALPAKKVERSSSGREAEVKEKIVVGWFFIERKDYRAATESLTEALEIDPSNLEAQAALRVARYAGQHSDVEVLPSNPASLGDGATKRSQ
jgi:serine/threonine protein kinase